MLEDRDIGANKGIILLVSLAVILLSCASAFLWLESQVRYEDRVFKTSVNVEPPENGSEKVVGVNTGAGLDYGNIPHDTNFTKFLNISADRKSLVKTRVSGNISEISYYDSEVYFEGSKSLGLTVGSPEPGFYQGKLRMRFQTPKTKEGSRWISAKRRLF